MRSALGARRFPPQLTTDFQRPFCPKLSVLSSTVHMDNIAPAPSTAMEHSFSNSKFMFSSNSSTAMNMSSPVVVCDKGIKSRSSSVMLNSASTHLMYS